MDDIVKQALAKWPNVPDCYGWLGLDARGRWYMRDEATQAQGTFPGSKGSLLQHEKLIGFIARNYEPDARGQWYFQNGPQRVYVELESTPLVWRIQPDFSVVSHAGHAAEVEDCLLDSQGRVYLTSGGRVGLVHTHDVPMAAQAVEAGHWVPREVAAEDLPCQYGFTRSPQACREASGWAPTIQTP
jgi:hypothetical protein